MKIDIDRVSVVTPNTLIGDLVLWHPNTAEVLYAIGVETIREAAVVHGVDANELTALLNEKIALEKRTEN